MSMQACPPELIGLVIEEFSSDRRALCALISTCKHFNYEATRLLYTSITMKDATSHIMYLQGLSERPTRAQLARIYHFPEAGDTRRGKLWTLIRQILPLMVNLRELLSPRTLPGHIKTPLLPIVKERSAMPFQLERFIWMTKAKYHDSKRALVFLGTQHKLKHLGWCVLPDIPSDKLPRTLSRLDAFSYCIPSVLSGRSIQELRWSIDDYTSAAYSESLTLIENIVKMKELQSLRILSLATHLADLVLRHMCHQDIGAFVKLEVLMVDSLCLLRYEFYNQLFCKLPRVTRLVFPAPYFDGAHSITLSVLHGHIQNAFKQLESLRYVDVYFQEDSGYRRWLNGVLLSEILDISGNSTLLEL